MKYGNVIRGLLAAALAGGSLASPATAQDGSQVGVPAPQPLAPGVEVRIRSGRSDAALPAVDESALRYFATRGDNERVEAEIARLRAKHPGWEPPADLFGDVSAVDEAPLWALYERGDYQKVREAIQELGREHADWSPPPKLLALMEENEVRKRLQALENAGAWQELLDVAERFPAQIACSRIDNMWRVARAQAEGGEREAAAATYRRIIEDCPSLDHRIATLQKASGHLDRAGLERLFEVEAGRDKPAAEAASIARVRKDLTEPARAATPKVIQALFRQEASIADARRAEQRVLQARHPKAAEKLGWLHHEAGDDETALVWFRRAHQWQPSAKTAEGLALTYAALGRFDEIEELARRYPGPLEPYLDQVESQRIVRAYESKDYETLFEATEAATDAGARTLRGWSLLELNRPTEASLTFASVVDDDEVKPSERREAAFGLARAAMALGRLEEAQSIVKTYRLPPKQRDEIHAEVLARQAHRAFEQQDWRTAVALLEARRSYAAPDRSLLTQEAWVRYHLGQKVVAHRMFEALNRVYATPDTEEGLRVVGRGIDRFGM